MSTTVDRTEGGGVLDEAYDAADLGRAIRRLRMEKRLTQDVLAQWLDVSRQTVVSMEHGGPVSVTAAMRALAILGAKVVVAPKDTIVGKTHSG
jgi:DNA-binding XRE family transcriptional regulator